MLPQVTGKLIHQCASQQQDYQRNYQVLEIIFLGYGFHAGILLINTNGSQSHSAVIACLVICAGAGFWLKHALFAEKTVCRKLSPQASRH